VASHQLSLVLTRIGEGPSQVSGASCVLICDLTWVLRGLWYREGNGAWPVHIVTSPGLDAHREPPRRPCSPYR
jgi:hypothetical protein